MRKKLKKAAALLMIAGLAAGLAAPSGFALAEEVTEPEFIEEVPVEETTEPSEEFFNEEAPEETSSEAAQEEVVKYAVVLRAEYENGTVKFPEEEENDPGIREFAEGEAASLQVVPDEGFLIGSVMVTEIPMDETQEEVMQGLVEADEDGMVLFAMPAYDMVVDVSFVPEEVEQTEETPTQEEIPSELPIEEPTEAPVEDPVPAAEGPEEDPQEEEQNSGDTAALEFPSDIFFEADHPEEMAMLMAEPNDRELETEGVATEQPESQPEQTEEQSEQTESSEQTPESKAEEGSTESMDSESIPLPSEEASAEETTVGQPSSEDAVSLQGDISNLDQDPAIETEAMQLQGEEGIVAPTEQQNNEPDINNAFEEDPVPAPTESPVTTPVEKTSAATVVVWDDAENQDGMRPERLKVVLYANGKAIAEKNVKESSNWKWEIQDLDKVDANGNPIDYTFETDAPSGYELRHEGGSLVLTHIAASAQFNVSAKWEDDNDSQNKRPLRITIRLMMNGKETDQTVVLDDYYDWVEQFKELKAYDNGKAIEYTVSAPDVDGYTKSISGNAENGFTITYTLAMPEDANNLTILDAATETTATNETSAQALTEIAKNVQTGIQDNYIPIAAALAGIAAAFCGFFLGRKRKAGKKQEEQKPEGDKQ